MSIASIGVPQAADSWPEAMEHSIGLGRNLGAVDDIVARDLITKIGHWEAQLTAIKLGLIRIVDEADLATKSGSTSTSDLLSGDFGGDRASASRQVRTAKNLKVATLTEKALEAGQITFDKAEVIAKTMANLPDDIDELTRVRIEKRLIGDARRLSLPDLRKRVIRVADIYATREQADLDEDTKLRHQEARAWYPGRAPSGRAQSRRARARRAPAVGLRPTYGRA